MKCMEIPKGGKKKVINKVLILFFLNYIIFPQCATCRNTEIIFVLEMLKYIYLL